jgi:hypothetical protein
MRDILSQAEESQFLHQGRQAATLGHRIPSIFSSWKVRVPEVRRTFWGKSKGSPAMGEPETTRYGVCTIAGYHMLSRMGREGLEPSWIHHPADFKSSAVRRFPHTTGCSRAAATPMI